MFSRQALDCLLEKNLPISELPRLQSKFRESIWKETLLPAEQIVARFSAAETLVSQALLRSGKILTLEESEPDVFASELEEFEETIETEIAIYKGRVEDMYCSCELGDEGLVCPHLRMLLYYIANQNNKNSTII